MSAIVVRFTGDANGPAAASTATAALRSSAPEEDADDELTTLRADDVPQPRPPRASTTARQPSGATLVRPFDDAPAGLRAPGPRLRSAWGSCARGMSLLLYSSTALARGLHHII